MVSRALPFHGVACESYEALTSSPSSEGDTLSSSSKEKDCLFGGKHHFTESLILAQDERWRRA